MERQSSTFEYLCRVCAANTKGKNSVAECVYILKTPSLKDKIEKYLYLTISDDDILPKVLCKTCFRQVEATASLSKIAKHTQKVFRDFIFNTKSYQQAESSSSENSTSTVTTTTAAAAAPAPAPPPAYTPPTAAAATNYAPTMPAPTERPKRKEREKEKAQVINADASPPPPAPAPTALAPPSSTCTHKDEVIVNVSVNDPLTRETQHKMITASRHRQNSIDTRFTPKSIAQRGFTSAPKQPDGPSPGKKQTASSGVINFFPNRPQQVTTITSGGYVIGPTSTENNAANAVTEIPTPPAAKHTNTQQKRRNLKTALSNLKPPNEGQVSLLKNSHKAGPTQQQQLSQLQPTAPSTKVMETAVPTLLVEDDVPVEPLPEKIIIAATKQQKHQAHAAIPAAPPPQPSPPSEVVEVLDADFQQEPQTEPTDLSQPTKTNIPDDILLGKVIKDGDLLKLILKALKWPVNKHNMEDQLERLRNSRFANIMADPNLLQDADLTQIMGPYLGPVLQAAQMLQQQQINAAAAAAALTKETELQVAGITNALPYKLPAETSVQLVPASPEAEEDSAAEVATVKASASNQSQKRNAAKDGGKPAKKPRKSAARGRSASVFNNDEFAALNAALTSQYLNSKSTPDFNADLDPAALFAQLGMLSGLSASSSNEALLALLQRQRIALSRMNQPPQQQQQQPPQPKPQPRRQRVNSIITVPASGSDFIFDTDDIILMEPDDGIVSTTTNSQNSTSENVVVLGNASTVAQSDANIIFTLPQQIPQPIITRPIIKRRKTVIQASPACMNLAINAQDLTTSTTSQQQQQAANVLSNATTATATTRLASTSVTNLLPLTTAAAQAPPQNQLSKTQSLDSLNVIATQYPSNIISIGTQMPSNTTQASEAAVVCTSISTKATETTLTLTATAATSVTSLAAPTNASTVSGAKAGRSTTTRNRSANTRRQPTSKAALGQQLLEAIGLQKVASETSKSVAAAPAAAALPSATPAASRGSVQQIRSALKKSLQKAQEHQQQQQRNKRTTSLTITEEIPNQNVNIVKEVVVQPRNKYTNNTPVGELDVEEEINKITLVLQSKSKDDKKVDEVADRRAAASPTKIPGIRRKLIPTTRNRKSAIVLVADEIVDLVDDEDNQDAAEGNVIEKNKNNEKAKDVRPPIAEKGDNEVQAKEANKNMKIVSPTRQRRRKLKPEEVQEMVDEEDDDYDEEDDKPLKPRTIKTVDNDKQEDESPNRAGTPRQRSRKTPANGRKAPSERDYDKESDDEASFKNDNESVTSSNVSTRPSRASKTNSRYYKGPDKSPSTPRRSAMSTRSSRAKN